MRTIQEELQENLQEDDLYDVVATSLDLDEVTFGDVRNEVVLRQYDYAKDVILQAMRDGQFEKLSYAARIKIRDTYRSASTNRNSPSLALNYMDSFAEEVLSSSLQFHVLSNLNLSREIQKIKKLGDQYKSFEEAYDKVLESKAEALADQLDIVAVKTRVGEIVTELLDRKEESENAFISVTADLRETRKALEEAKGSEKEIEAKKLAVNTFVSNIEEYKARIDAIELQAKNVVGQDTKIKKLIEQAEAALQLTSAQGISGAFTKQHQLASSNWSILPWVFGCGAFIVLAIVITLRFVSETKLATDHVINPILVQYPWIVIVGRAVAVSICLSAAAFCARQYTKQKNLAEDYAYKSVLSKSIVAFTKEIKKVDEEKATEYLTTVLEEIHKDPLRTKMTKSDGLSTLDIDAFITRFSETLSKHKS